MKRNLESELRKEASQRLLVRISRDLSGSVDAERLVHELRVHQIELEMQNEELRLAQLELLASREQFFTLYELSPVGHFTLTKRQMITMVNERGVNQLGWGKDQLINCSFQDVIFPADKDIFDLATGALDRSNEPQHCELRLVHQGLHRIWARLDMSTIEESIQVAVTDITSTKDAEQQRARLVRELDHRVKNNLAQVVVLAQHSIEQTADIAEFQTSFVGRVKAMASAHELLATNGWKNFALSDILSILMKPFLDATVLGGPKVHLPSTLANPMAMIVRELTTNAAKYGSLSVSTGRVSVSWTVGVGGLELTWLESGGPEVPAAPTMGLGTDILHGIVEYELGGTIEANFETNGVRCVVTVPLESISNE
jgi:PAS domain S-box-containing protein